MNKQLKKICALFLAAIMLFALAACGGSNGGNGSNAGTPSTGGDTPAAPVDLDSTDWSSLPKTTVVFASAQSSQLATSVYLADEAQKINELTGGQLTIQMQFDSKLGGDTEEIEAIQAGDIDMMTLSSSALLAFVPEVAVFDMPMMFDDAETAIAGVPELGASFDPITASKGIKTLGVGLASFRALTTNTNIQKIEDIKGMKIRTLENKYHMDFWENLGAEPTPISFTDLYLSLQQGLVGAQDNSIEAVQAMKFYEVQDYYMPITAFMNVTFVIASPAKWNALAPEYQALIQKYVDDYMEVAYGIGDQGAQDARKAIGGDLTDLEFTDAIKAGMLEAAKPVWKSVRADIGDELCDAYLAVAGRTE